MKWTTSGAVLSVLLLVSACAEPTVPSYNDPSAQELTGNPSRTAIAAAAQGMLRGQRGLTNGWIVTTGIWGREGYNLRPEEPRTVTNTLIDPIDGSAAFWSAQYSQIQNAFVLLDATDAAEALSEPEREALRGFVKTLMASAYFDVIVMHGDFGAPIDTNRNPNDELAPIASEDEVWSHVFELYDEAMAHLQNAASFPFTFTPGLADFATPQTFIQLNRALKVRALKYRGRWDDVLAALPESFISRALPLSYGAYHDFSTNSGDEVNALFVNSGVYLYAHPRLKAEAQTRPDGTPDLRAQNKLADLPNPFTFADITVTEKFTIYDSNTAPIPWIRNEELILIRAEANLAMGNTTVAAEDINFIREHSGGLEPIADLASRSDEEILDELLYNKRYSLVWEGGFTYLDARQYDRLDQLPRALPSHVVYPRYPFPTNECLARDMMSAPACQPVEGF